MPTRTRYTPPIDVPDLVGVKADPAIQKLRELWLVPIPCPAEVHEGSEAGFVLGLEPVPGSPVRPRTQIMVSVGTHPDGRGRADNALGGQPKMLAQQPSGLKIRGLATPQAGRRDPSASPREHR